MTYCFHCTVRGEIYRQPQTLMDYPEGRVAAFECGVRNNRPRAPITYTWYKNNVEIVSNSRVYVNSWTGTLYIRETSSSDDGAYHCVVGTTLGTITSQTANFAVDSSEYTTQLTTN